MHIFITPFGMSFGVLYSGIHLIKPDHVIVLTSLEAAQNVEITVAAAREVHANFTVEVHTIKDPFAGFVQGRQLATVLAQRLRAQNEGGENRYTVSLTGGTTALQDAAKCLADQLQAREVALIDRRDEQEKRTNPLEVGELIEIPKDYTSSQHLPL